MNGCLKRIAQTIGVIILLIVALVLVAVATAPDGAPTQSAIMPTATGALLPTVTPAPSPTPTLAWYAGGTLHSATIAEWKAADERNKLATAADWAAQGWDTVANLQQNATELWACVDEAATAAVDTATVTDLAVGCVILLKDQ